MVILNGSFKPDEKITRAEFAALVVKGFKLSGKSGKVFADTADHWAKDFIATANAYGIVNGYSNSNFGPNDPITREQMAVMIIKAVGLTDTGSARTFADSQNISSWAREAVAIATGNNIMTGYPDFTFKPQGNATRAEAAVVLDKTLAIKAAPVEEEEQVKAEYVSIDKAGTYGPETGTKIVDYNVTIKAKDVTLRNLVIKGDLIIAKEVGDGDVTLNNVKVEGKTYIRGGGKDSIYINGGQYKEIIVEKTATGGVRIVVNDSNNVNIVIAEVATGEEIILNGAIDKVTIKADDVKVITQAGTEIKELKVESGLDNVTIDLVKDSTVNEMILDSKTDVKGEGNINVAKGSKASDSNFSSRPGSIERPSTGGGGGGGSGGGSGSSDPSTEKLNSISVTGVAVIGETLTVNVSPDKATVNYQWMRSDSEKGSYAPIEGATGNTYKLDSGDAGKYIKVAATGTGNYQGTVESNPVGPVLAATISMAEPSSEIKATEGWTRFAGKVDVADGVEGIKAYYIFEITEGNLAQGTVLQYYHYADGSWLPFAYEGNDQYRFGDINGFDLATVDNVITEFQVKIGESIKGRAYLVDAATKNIISNVVEAVISSPVYNLTQNSGYNTIQAAIEAANAGDTIKIGAGIYDEALTIDKSVTLLGVYADNDPRILDFTEKGSMVNGGIRITGKGVNVTIKGLTITKKGILASDIASLTVVNNLIKDIKEMQARDYLPSVIGIDVIDATESIEIKNNVISNIGSHMGDKAGEGMGIRIMRAADDIIISDNLIKDLMHNGINVYQKCLTKEDAKLVIKGNEIVNWDSDQDNRGIGGRAIRLEFDNSASSATAEITENKLIPPTYGASQNPVDEEYVKLTYVGIKVDLSKNYWGSPSPDFGTILLVDGARAKDCDYVPYYIDETMTELGPMVTITREDGSISYYATIQDAINEAQDGDFINIGAGTYNEAIKVDDKSLTLKGVDGTIITKGVIAKANTAGKTIEVSGIEFITAGLEVNGYDDVKVLNNKFSNITSWTDEQLADRSADAIYVHGSETGKVLIQGNTINGVECNRVNVGDGVGITVLDLDYITIEGNTISDTWHNSINIYRGVAGQVTITSNTFSNWDSNQDEIGGTNISPGCEGGRAIRIDLAGALITVTANTFLPNDHSNPVDSEYVKITGVGGDKVNELIKSLMNDNTWPLDTDFSTAILVNNIYGSVTVEPSIEISEEPKKDNEETIDLEKDLKVGQTDEEIQEEVLSDEETLTPVNNDGEITGEEDDIAAVNDEVENVEEKETI